MQKILSGNQVKSLDQKYIEGEVIHSYQLMERAAQAFCNWFVAQVPKEKSVSIYCGTGNNGGDGLAISRILNQMGYSVAVGYIGNPDKGSADFQHNLHLLPEKLPVSNWEKVAESEVLIDAVFGVGINRPLEGEYLKLIRYLNERTSLKISVDTPSGLPSDGPLEGEVFRADYTLSFQFPKLSLLAPEHAACTGKLTVQSIGIEQRYFDSFESNRFFFSGENLIKYHKKFLTSSHKGDFGRVVLAGGSYGKMGSIGLSTRAALRTGSGLVFCHIPACGVEIIQGSIPEAMVLPPGSEKEVGDKLHTEGIDAVGIGPGLGKGKNAAELVYQLLSHYSGPTVLDADAINILGDNPAWLNSLHSNVVLTPHLKEFERLTGVAAKNHFHRMDQARDFAREYSCTLVLKGAFTLISFPDGQQVFNNSGSLHMATGGSGDVLTGILTSFLGQGYTMKNAVLCGVFHHGHAGELAGADRGRGTLASDILERIPDSLLHYGIA
ncbi:NAD(P)H-hydrate dehydratase [Cyclobacterium salsum]|uniref:NAD(P)H-hydrate dehydratase n=1 Tax=Cyclobacterium salsum TaxID=2666329 RepID=UPI00139112F4|nr:NAD(P)H-hydrate dehydratase [Cyclobacterium salsum]